MDRGASRGAKACGFGNKDFLKLVIESLTFREIVPQFFDGLYGCVNAVAIESLLLLHLPGGSSERFCKGIVGKLGGEIDSGIQLSCSELLLSLIHI